MAFSRSANSVLAIIHILYKKDIETQHIVEMWAYMRLTTAEAVRLEVTSRVDVTFLK